MEQKDQTLHNLGANKMRSYEKSLEMNTTLGFDEVGGLDIQKITEAFMSNKNECISEILEYLDDLLYDEKFAELETNAKRIRDIAVSTLGEQNQYELDFLELLGDMYYQTSQFDKAKQTYLDILNTPELRKQLMPYQHGDYHRKLGSVAYKQKDYRQALLFLDKAKALLVSLERPHYTILREIDATRSYVYAELGYTQQGQDAFLSAFALSSTSIDEILSFLEGHVQFAEHLFNAQETALAEHFADCGIKYALEYQRRISEFLVDALRKLSNYSRLSDPEMSAYLMRKSCEMAEYIWKEPSCVPDSGHIV